MNPRIEPYLKQVVPVLEHTLKDADPRVCEGAAVALLYCIKQRPALVATVLDYLDSELTSPREIPATEAAAISSGDPSETARIARRNELLQRRELARRAAIPVDAFDEVPAARVAPPRQGE